jgi:hypothetical protein
MPELNAPNTLATNPCADGSSPGRYQRDESVEAIRVGTVDGSPLRISKMARVEADVWVVGGKDTVYLLAYGSASAAPNTILVQTSPKTSGLVTVAGEVRLMASPTQTVRAVVRRDDLGPACSVNANADYDDLAFAVDPTPIDPPTVAITSPIDGATVTGPIQVEVIAADAEGINSVHLYANGMEIGLGDTWAPYTFTWTPSADGQYTLTAIASDNDRFYTESAPITVTVALPPPPPDTTGPTVSLWAPGTWLGYGGVVPLEITATDPSGVSLVEWYQTPMGSAETLFASFVPTSSTTVVPWDTRLLPDGDCGSRIVATDGLGNSSIKYGTFRIDNSAPTVSITSPLAGAVLRKGLLTVSATASDATPTSPGSGVIFVELFADGASLGKSPSPVTATWDARAAGSGAHTLSAVATDNAGNQASTSIAVTVR